MSQARIQKWGNSLAVRIPKPYAAQVGLGPNSVVNVSIVDGRLLLEPVEPPQYTLADLLAGITEANRHHEVDTGGPVGLEVW